MGLRTRRRTWQPVDTGITDGGDISDEQTGQSYSIRYVCPDVPGSMITVTWYPVQTGPFLFRVERETEWLVCTDPADRASTEVWSDYEYETVPSRCPCLTPRDAEWTAWQKAETALAEPPAFDWDGQPWSAA